MLKKESYFIIKKNHFYMLYPNKQKVILVKKIIFITTNKYKVNSTFLSNF
jgi:hypothetical protein